MKYNFLRLLLALTVLLLCMVYALQYTSSTLNYEKVDKLVVENVDLNSPNSHMLAHGRNALINQINKHENGIYRWHATDGNLFLENSLTEPAQLKIIPTGEYIIVTGPNQVYELLATVGSPNAVTFNQNAEYKVYNLRVAGTGTFQKGATVIGTVNGRDFAAENAVAEAKPENLNELVSSQVTQLANIDGNTIANAQWGYMSELTQDLGTGENVTFQSVSTDNSVSYIPNSNTLYTSSGSAVFPAGTKGVVVEVQAGGGAGGSEGITNDVAGGGGSGSYAMFFLDSSQIDGQTGLDFTVAGVANQSNGSNSTVSWQGGALLATTYGGSRAVSGNLRAEGGNAGSIAVLQPGVKGFVWTGYYGQAGFDYNNVLYTNVQSGQGGNTMYGAGGGSGLWTGEGGVPIAGQFGGGGAGGVDDLNTTGASGGAGFVRVWLYT